MSMIPFTDYALYIWIQKNPSTLNALKVNWGGGILPSRLLHVASMC